MPHGPKLLTALGLAPISIYYALLFVGSIGIFLAYSFYRFEDFDFVPAFQLGNYGDVLGSELYQTLILRTLLLALAVSVVVVTVSYTFVYLINFVFARHRALLYFLVLVSLFSGYLVRIYAWRTLLGAQGVVNEALLTIGLIDRPLRFLLNGWFAVGVALVNFMIPLAVLPLHAAMANVSPKTLEAARDLGAGPVTIFRQVLLPLTRGGIVVAFAFVFIASAADVVTPTLLGGVQAQMVGTAVQAQFGTTFDWPFGAALSFTLMAVVLAVVATFGWTMKAATR
ncbi:MAG: spermidine/putrescine transport system permease protein [Thermoleophilaceae bacterium]|jgi:spermidine/putrescine transport system permease protein|nr:spermidine/putrescine transport system permease protein [Thermoleophilaceae bacterium]MEA2408691.1 spermidine/putrescine transport system permease protein [Thermoleophilaceae bacterium]